MGNRSFKDNHNMGDGYDVDIKHAYLKRLAMTRDQ